MKLPFGSASDVHIEAELLSSYLDNQVAPDERLRIEQHLRTCSACQTEYNSLRQTVRLLQALPRVPVPRPFTLSEAQVGARRPARAAWGWGAARALGAAVALVLVAVFAVQLLERANQPGASQVALLRTAPAATQPSAAPTTASAAAPVQAVQPTVPEAATAATQPSTEAAPAPAAPLPTRTAKAAVPPSTAKAAQDQVRAPTGKPAVTNPPGPTAGAPAVTGVSATAGVSGRSVAPTAAGAATAAEPAAAAAAAGAANQSATPGNTETPAGVPSAPAIALAPAASPSATIEQAPQVFSAAATGAPSPAPIGRGGGGPGPATTESQAPGVPLPPSAPLEQGLPGNSGLVYTDHQSIQSVDNHGGRQLIQAPGAAAPMIAPDRSWVAYRVQTGENAAIWAVPWDGGDARMLADSGKFPGHDDIQGGPVQIETTQWLPGDHTLGMIVSVADPNGTGAPRRELWTAAPGGQAPHFVAELGLTGSPVFAPDGKAVAVLQRGGPEQPQGRLYLANVDGGTERLALEFPADPNGYGYEGQVAWLPNSRDLWVAIPEPGASAAEGAKLDLYRASLDGQAELAGHLQANDAYWSPDGKMLAFTRPAGAGSAERMLGVANADGSNARDYAPIGSGGFAKWSPDGRRFLYYTGDQWFIGSPDEQPQPIGPVGSIAEPHWVTSGQLLYLLDAGANWELVSRAGNGKTSSLISVPKEVEITMTGR